MKEITMITTCEITVIEKLKGEQVGLIKSKSESDLVKELSEIIKSAVDADHVNILKNQLFIRDVQEQKSGDVK